MPNLFQKRPLIRLTFLVLTLTSGLLKAASLKWHHSYAEALAEAKQKKKPIFLAFR
jgi:hypothetical protein